MKILLAEDDPVLCANVVKVLHRENIAVDLATTGDDALHLGSTARYDVVVLDLGLPNIDGIDVLQNWRRSGCDFPVLILTAREVWRDKAAAFQAGADDYLTKPFLPQELVARLRALVRRARGLRVESVQCGRLSFDPLTGTFQLAGVPLRLTAFETRILSKLVQFPETVVSREALLEAVYEYSPDADAPIASFEVLVGRLRKKIGPEMIETVRGVGYRLTATES
jgi:DNA-binding response OmpR family regulator